MYMYNKKWLLLHVVVTLDNRQNAKLCDSARKVGCCINNRKVTPDRIEEFKAESGRQKWWQDRANTVYEGGLF